VLLFDATKPITDTSHIVVFRICGWHNCDDVPINGVTIASASADPVTNGQTGDQMWISINQSA
jgi:hypothetical protein